MLTFVGWSLYFTDFLQRMVNSSLIQTWMIRFLIRSIFRHLWSNNCFLLRPEGRRRQSEYILEKNELRAEQTSWIEPRFSWKQLWYKVNPFSVEYLSIFKVNTCKELVHFLPSAKLRSDNRIKVLEGSFLWVFDQNLSGKGARLLFDRLKYRRHFSALSETAVLDVPLDP